MSFIVGVMTTLMALFAAAMFYAIGLQNGRESVALHLKACLEVASAESICDNRILDTYLSKSPKKED